MHMLIVISTCVTTLHLCDNFALMLHKKWTGYSDSCNLLKMYIIGLVMRVGQTLKNLRLHEEVAPWPLDSML